MYGNDQEYALDDLACEAFENAMNKGFYDSMDEQDLELAFGLMIQTWALAETLEAKRKGRSVQLPEYPDPKNLTERQLRACMSLMLVVTEVVEVWDDVHQGDIEHEAEEVADIFIRMFDYAAYRGIDLDKAVREKMAKNRDRPFKHGKRF